jgi:hypothetical protein
MITSNPEIASRVRICENKYYLTIIDDWLNRT